MSQFQVLAAYEAKQFDSPPKFSTSERKEYFTVDPCIEFIIKRNASPELKVGAVLQLGYFKATNKFFATNTFRKEDIRYVKLMLSIKGKLRLTSNYAPVSKNRHKHIILEGLGYASFNQHKDLFDETIKTMV